MGYLTLELSTSQLNGQTLQNKEVETIKTEFEYFLDENEVQEKKGEQKPLCIPTPSNHQQGRELGISHCSLDLDHHQS